MEPNGKTTAIEQIAPITSDSKDLPLSYPSTNHATPEVIGLNDDTELDERGTQTTVEELEEGKGRWFAYIKTRNFYLVLLLGYAFSQRRMTFTREG